MQYRGGGHSDKQCREEGVLTSNTLKQYTQAIHSAVRSTAASMRRRHVATHYSRNPLYSAIPRIQYRRRITACALCGTPRTRTPHTHTHTCAHAHMRTRTHAHTHTCAHAHMRLWCALCGTPRWRRADTADTRLLCAAEQTRAVAATGSRRTHARAHDAAEVSSERDGTRPARERARLSHSPREAWRTCHVSIRVTRRRWREAVTAQ
jgi:hypothetical protein